MSNENQLIELTWSHVPMQLLSCRLHYLERWSFDNLAAPYWRWYANDRPGWTAIYNGKEYPLTPDGWLAIAPETPFAAHGTNPAWHTYIHFSLGRPFDRVPHAIYHCTHDSEDRQCLKQLQYAQDNDLLSAARRDMLLQSWMRRCLCRLPTDALPANRLDQRIEQLMDLMQNNVQQPPTNEQLAQAIHLHTNAMIRLFKQQTGTTPQAWMTELRIRKACRDLHHTDRTIDAIADALGFADRYHFSRVFKRHRRMPPARFRRIGPLAMT